MANIKLTIQHGNNLFEPPIEDGVEIEWERRGSPGKLTFTTLKVHPTDMSFQEGDPVCFYYDEKPIFLGYVFTKKRDREHHIKVTCYDQIRYLKNKFTYSFEKKTATQITTTLCNDFKLLTGTFDNTNYVLPSRIEENKSALDIILKGLDETLINTGEMYILYDDFGKLQLKNASNMVSTTLICKDTAENFDYTSSIDEETYNQIVLYYDPNSNSNSSSDSTLSDVDKMLKLAKQEIGVSENPKGSNHVKYNTEYYGWEAVGENYPWCCVFIWWLFKHCDLSHLFYDGKKTASCNTAANWFQVNKQWVTKNYKPGDIVFFKWDNSPHYCDHVGIVESVDGNKITCIEGNYCDKVTRVKRSSHIVGAGRPKYASSTSKLKDTDMHIFTASSQPKINEWGLLRHFEKVDTPSNGQNKAISLLKLYNNKTRELKVNGAFGDINIRGGTLIPVKLDLGDTQVKNFMLVEKVKHKFDNDHHTMDLTLEGAWEDTDLSGIVSNTSTIKVNSSTSNGSSSLGSSSTSNNSTSSTSSITRKSTISIMIVGGENHAGTFEVVYTRDGKQYTSKKYTNTLHFTVDEGSKVYLTINDKSGCGHKFEAVSGTWTEKSSGKYVLTANNTSACAIRWWKLYQVG